MEITDDRHFEVTYIHNWPLQAFSQDYGLVSHTIYVVCVNFIHKLWNQQFNVDSERQIFDKLLHSKFLPEEIAKEIFFFIFRFDAWNGIRTRINTLLTRLRQLHFEVSNSLNAFSFVSSVMKQKFFVQLSYSWL